MSQYLHLFFTRSNNKCEITAFIEKKSHFETMFGRFMLFVPKDFDAVLFFITKTLS